MSLREADSFPILCLKKVVRRKEPREGEKATTFPSSHALFSHMIRHGMNQGGGEGGGGVFHRP